mgnify:CR=1 FL=1
MEVTLLEIVTPVRFVQLINAQEPILVTPFWMRAVLMELLYSSQSDIEKLE